MSHLPVRSSLGLPARASFGLALAAMALLSFTACERFDAPHTEIDCSHGAGDRARVTGAAQAWRATVDGRPVVHVEGTAEHEDGLAIQRIEVARVSADPGENSFNFSDWAVDLDLASVANLTPDTETGEVLLSVLAFDSCDRSYDIGPVSIALRDPPSVDRLTVTIDYPGGEDHLPSTISVPAAVTVTATGNPAGVALGLSTERGTFLGAAEDASTRIDLRLSPTAGNADTANASAFLVASGAESGDALVTATALNVAATARVRVAGPPRLTPPGGDLLFGGVQPVWVSTDGRLVSCKAEPPLGVTVDYAGRESGGVVEIDEVDDRRATLLVSVDEELLEKKASFVITCKDAYGQEASATYNTPEPPPPEPEADGGGEGGEGAGGGEFGDGGEGEEGF